LLHQRGHGARLTQVVIESGGSLELARLWRCETAEEARWLERKLKKVHGHGPALYPICQGLPLDVYTSMRQGHYQGFTPSLFLTHLDGESLYLAGKKGIWLLLLSVAC